MKKVFMFEQHFLTKALAQAKITFPISKADAMEKAGDIQVQVDFDRYAPLRDLINNATVDYFPISAVFVNAYVAGKMKSCL